MQRIERIFHLMRFLKIPISDIGLPQRSLNCSFFFLSLPKLQAFLFMNAWVHKCQCFYCRAPGCWLSPLPVELFLPYLMHRLCDWDDSTSQQLPCLHQQLLICWWNLWKSHGCNLSIVGGGGSVCVHICIYRNFEIPRVSCRGSEESSCGDSNAQRY